MVLHHPGGASDLEDGAVNGDRGVWIRQPKRIFQVLQTEELQAGSDGGLGRGSSVRRPESEGPHQR